MNNLYSLIESLACNSKIIGLKKETEAEGATAEEIYLFRALSWKAGLPLHVKIGGVEAVSDVRLCKYAQVDAIIAPMVESPFALQKFVQAMDMVYAESTRPRCIITIESKTAMEQFDAIFSKCAGVVDDITIGRTDLSASYADTDIVPDSDFILDKVKYVASHMNQSEIALNLGGEVGIRTPALLQEHKHLLSSLQSIETRNVILSANANQEDIAAALQFEKDYLSLSKLHKQHDVASIDTRLEKLLKRQ